MIHPYTSLHTAEKAALDLDEPLNFLYLLAPFNDAALERVQHRLLLLHDRRPRSFSSTVGSVARRVPVVDAACVYFAGVDQRQLS